MKILIKDAVLVNEGTRFKGSLLTDNDKISRIFNGNLPDNF